ncbi:uncharacterized protein L3040_003090 [Drepanopeziza brunnea f. sp. 'multigermtubi']|uniref:uncharacterized protein n=1 Tax=Drepanopeziza brunnea f. sp. 'multigermtubi' TaxID=698441 RepID=UPI00238A321D|nr:hypothetical protein L3040_003090 [Drepanopeziza brunnea f. sp. 'multigermtubi']
MTSPSTHSTLLICGNAEAMVDGKQSPCPKLAPNVCKGCFLIQYCSKECQVAHWVSHKVDCKSPLMKSTWKPSWQREVRKPAFITGDSGPFAFGQTKYGKQKYLWGNVPAIDVVNHCHNEAANLPERFSLLFAASGDVRNVVKSLAGLPHSYSGQCEVVINDRDFDIVARNVIILLTSLYFDPDEAANIMLHIWYSALIPKQMLCSLQDKILPLFQEVCSKTRGRPAAALQSKTWSRGARSLRLVLPKGLWDCLPSYLQVPDGLSSAQAQKIMMATTLPPERRDYVDRAHYTRPPPWRVCTTKFRRDGILLPFGNPRSEFDTPNPTFYQTTDFWPMMDSADPLGGWNIKDVMRLAPLAKNDIYGSLFNYLQDLLLQFCNQVSRLPVHFQLFQVDALDLPGILRQRGMDCPYFDRIEVSNIGDRGYLGPQTIIGTFGPLLKDKSHNPCATLLTLFLNAVHEEFSEADSLLTIKSESIRLQNYLPTDPAKFQPGHMFDAEFMRFNDARLMVRDFDKVFEKFMQKCDFPEIGKAAGLVAKSKNTIIEPWPLRLTTKSTRAEFDLLHASGHIGSERYVEWERVLGI